MSVTSCPTPPRPAPPRPTHPWRSGNSVWKFKNSVASKICVTSHDGNIILPHPTPSVTEHQKYAFRIRRQKHVHQHGTVVNWKLWYFLIVGVACPFWLADTQFLWFSIGRLTLFWCFQSDHLVAAISDLASESLSIEPWFRCPNYCSWRYCINM